MRRERDRRGTARRAGGPSLAPLAPAIWLEPNPLDTLASGRVASAYDLSGNSRHATQGTAANQPLAVAGAGPGGRDVYRFASARPDWLSIAHDAGLTGLDWTFFVVTKMTGNGSVFSKAASNVPSPFDGLIIGGPMGLAGERNGVTTVSDNTWRAVGGRRGVAIAEASVWVGGVKDAFGALGALTNTGTAIRIGRRDDGFGSLSGDIACACAWTRALTDPEIAQVHAYFTARFGL